MRLINVNIMEQIFERKETWTKHTKKKVVIVYLLLYTLARLG